MPDAFARTITDVYGDEGAAWLAGLSGRIARYAARWSLTVGPPLGLSYNYVAPAIRADGTPAVLKLGVPGHEVVREIAAVRLCAGDGMARLLEADDDAGAFLIERLLPGTPLGAMVESDDEQATVILARVMRRLWRPPPSGHAFRPVSEWAKGMERLRVEFGGGSGPFPAHLVDQAETLFEELFASAAAPVVLHGDLHHDNVLAATRAPWLAIDPKGMTGEPAYEVGAMLHNPFQVLYTLPDIRRVLERRIHILADELVLDPVRIRDWGLAQAVLSAWWSYEDHGRGWEKAIICAEHLAAIRG